MILKIDDLLKLKEAGFSSEEIANLANVVDRENVEVPDAQEQIDFTQNFEDLKNTIISEVKAIFVNANVGGTERNSAESVDDILKNHFNGGK